jgi:sugar phosphate isomerase/epimerase
MTPLVPGLCSVTFRALDVTDVVALAQRAGLEAVEWGADVHVLPGDTAGAVDARDRCLAAGISCPSYGSYFMAGHSPDPEFHAVASTAATLGASTVRVWAPGDPRAAESESARVVRSLAHACDVAIDHQLTVAVEYHPGTLTEDATATTRLVTRVGRPNFAAYWQPHPGPDAAVELAALRHLADHLAHLHVFSWTAHSERLPLAEHAEMWRDAMSIAADQRAEGTRCAYLEFVEGDDPEALIRDAATLRAWLDRDR